MYFVKYIPVINSYSESPCIIKSCIFERYSLCWSYIDTCVSGSPIIQDGKLVGAVTHVLVNDPTTGYGIFIENMLDAAA